MGTDIQFDPSESAGYPFNAMFSLFAEKIPQNEQTHLVRRKVAAIARACAPSRILLIGSAARRSMTEASDIDLVVILDSEQDIKKARLAIALARKQDSWPQDIILTTEEEFEDRSEIGGVLYVAHQEGIEVHPQFRLGETTE